MIVTRLDVLREPFRSAVYRILAEAMERRVYFVVSETIRTYERQQELFNEGKSRTMHSNHLIGKAVDLAPVVSFRDGVVEEVSWDKTHPAWKVLGELADKHKVTWGGRWENFPDFPHLEAGP